MEFRLKQITSKKNVLFEPSQLLIWRGCDLIGLGKPMFTSRAAIFTLELTKTTCCIIMPHHERVFPSVSSMHRQLRPVPYWRFDYYSAPERGAEYCDDRICLSACIRWCLSAIISSELHVRSSPNFCTCYLWPWLGPPLAA